MKVFIAAMIFLAFGLAAGYLSGRTKGYVQGFEDGCVSERYDGGDPF